MKLSVVIPVYNEERTLAEIVGRPRLHARGNLFRQEFEEQLGHLRRPASG